jgi:VanZ family protein
MVNAKGWVRAGCGVAAVLLAATIFIGAEDVAKTPLFPAPYDKLAHFIYYGVMAALLSHALGSRWLWVPLLMVPVVGFFDEWNQVYIVGRDASVWDWVADVLGTTVFIYGYRHWAMNRSS